MSKPLLDSGQIKALSAAAHGDPFSVLGMHEAKIKGKKAIVVRALYPNASNIWVCYGNDEKAKMDRISDEGLFELVFTDRKERFSYTFHIEQHEGEDYEVVDPYSFGPLVDDFDLQLWGEGNHRRAWELMGAHVKTVDGVKGTHFVVSAPSALRVSIIGSFNNWDGRVHPMRKYHDQGIWELFIPGVGEGDFYKYEIKTQFQGPPLKKADPYAFYSELRPGTASVVHELQKHEWNDQQWMEERKKRQDFDQPISIYEVHLGSWMRKPGEDPGYLSYREMADKLVPYVADMGYTHVELLPVCEHPYDPSWGYQITGYYAPTSRFGKPEDFMYLVDKLHEAGVGVIMDWVPGHFTKDDHGLRRFDGTALYEHEDPRQGEHREWGTNIFNYGRIEVQNFLVSNALYWCELYHIDGLRVDAVASMLYLDYDRDGDDWIPNRYGGRENLEAIQFLKHFNGVLHHNWPGVVTMAEESTAWQGVTSPPESGGLGFDYKWNMGWMNDTLTYMKKDPIYRKYHQDQLTFSLIYSFSENFVLPLSHDEVVHMKNSLAGKMPGDDWQKFANLRLLYTYMYGHPGKKLLFMGGEFAQWQEWTEAHSIDWHLLDWKQHRGVQQLVKDMNKLYKQQPALHQVDFNWEGFQWIDLSDSANSIISFIRHARNKDDQLIFILNFTPEVHHNYKIGVPFEGRYQVLLNSDADAYGGSDVQNNEIIGKHGNWQNQPAHIEVDIPPLGGLVLKHAEG